MPKNLYILILFLLNIIEIIKGDEEPTSRKHKVENFYKDLGDIDYKGEVYSGYLKTNIPDNELFYIFTPSLNNPEKDPLILYLEGGPGCSSLIGLLIEVGPVTISSETNKLELNEYSWVNNASILFIDSPAEVGFSKFKEAIHNNDSYTVENLYAALKDFYEIFTEYKKNDLFISGFSYAGIYIPYLVQQIKGIDNNNTNTTEIKLKGILIGSPYTSSKYNYDITLVESIFSHGIISIDIYNEYLENCPHYPVMISTINLTNATNDFVYLNDTDQPVRLVNHSCNEVKQKIQTHLKGFPFMGIYNKCKLKNNYNDLNNNFYLDPKIRLLNKPNDDKIRYLTEQEISILNQNRKLEDNLEQEYPLNDTCELDNTIETFLNNNTIKEKLGVNTNLIFSQCKSLKYKFGDSTNFYKEHLGNLKNFSCWLFSGTEDLSVPILGTLYWIGELNLTISKEWDMWNFKNKSRGMIQNYTNGLHYLTIKKGSHVLVTEQRELGKYLFDQFIAFNYPIHNNSDDDGGKTNPENPEEGKGSSNSTIYIVVGIVVLVLIAAFIIFKVVMSKKKVTDITIETTTGPLSEN